jgi:carboxymethylenebutenolidase
MCYDADAVPPADEHASTPVEAAPITLTSADGTRFAAWQAGPRVRAGAPGAGPGPTGVVVLPDNRGLAGFYERLAERLAGHGHPAVAIDWFGRTAGPDDRDRGPDFPFMRHLAGLDRTGMQADLVAAADRLRGLGCARVVALGFCMGGRNAFMASAPRFGLAGVIGFYGAPGAVGPYGPGPLEHADELGAPILGLFGEADHGIPVETVAAFDTALTAAGVPHELVTYPGAPHGFFDAAEAGAHEAACADAWRRVLAFLRA